MIDAINILYAGTAPTRVLARCCEQVGDWDSVETVELLARYAKHPDKSVRIGAVHGLSKLRKYQVANAMLRVIAIDESAGSVWFAACEALDNDRPGRPS